jgi:alpha-2-macroglobulin
MRDSRPSYAPLAVAGIVLCAGVFWAVDARFESEPPPAAPQPAAANSASAIAQAQQQAVRLFGNSQWAEARAAYDQVLDLAEYWSSDESRFGLRGGVICSLKLGDFDGALGRVSEFATGSRPKKEFRPWWPAPGGAHLDGPIDEIADLELVRDSLEQISRAVPAVGFEKLTDQVTKARLETDLRLLTMLDPDSIPMTTQFGSGSQYSDIDWWWADLRSKAGPNDRDESVEVWSYWVGIPQAAGGGPLFLHPPAKCDPGLSRRAKIQFLLDEVERLDRSPAHDGVAQALLHRADLARRLYGPVKDEDWRRGEFEYRIRQRPWFRAARAKRHLKPFWELEDDEARAVVGGRLQILKLPPAESPLALWGRIEKECPQSEVVPEAIYQRALYLQDRRQFAKAIAEYQRLISRFPNHERRRIAEKQIFTIEHADVLLGDTGTYRPGSQPTLWFACRNTAKVEFVARRFDLRGYVADSQTDQAWGSEYLGLFRDFGDDDPFGRLPNGRAKFLGPRCAHWTEMIPRSDRVASHTTRAPLTEIGAYIVEARVPGIPEASSGLVLVSDVALIQKQAPHKVLLWAVNSQSGQPLPNQKVEVYSRPKSSNEKGATAPTLLRTDARGLTEIKPEIADWSYALVEGPGGGLALWLTQDRGPVGWDARGIRRSIFGVTDRPIYRPGSTVKFRLWIRELLGRQYRPARDGVRIRVHARHLRSDEDAFTLEGVTDETGSLAGSFALGPHARLGDYRVFVTGADGTHFEQDCKFSVEEYKRPEFEVTIEEPKTPPRLGEMLTVRVQARYYFGAPVAEGRMSYLVSRAAHRTRYAAPSEWDWLYGNGFGDYNYWYPWLDTGEMQDENTRGEESDPYDRREEKVAAGLATLDADGSAEIHVDTSKDSPDFDQQYTFEVQVRDAGRRTIDGTQTVLVARHSVAAFAQLDGGWYQPGSRAAVDVNTCTAGGAPLNIAGTLSLEQIDGKGDGQGDGKSALIRPLERWPLRTGANGHVRFLFRAGDEGQYRLAFDALDDRRQPVRATVNFWVHGPKFDSRSYRGAALELIPDRRWYQPGQTARILVHTAQRDARLLLWDCFDRVWFESIPAHARVLEIPITDREVPNYPIQALVVGGDEFHTERCELFVPPIRDVVKIDLHPDQGAYRPGQKGLVQIRATDYLGHPVAGSLALRAFDKSLTYIRPEDAEGPRGLLTRRKAYFWNAEIESTLGGRPFKSLGSFVCPEYHFDDATRPQIQVMGGSAGKASDPSEGKDSQASAQRRNAGADRRPEIRTPVPERRQNFAETAAWLPQLKLDAQGTARAEIVYPESLTTWRLHAYYVSKETHVGDATSEVTTTKPFVVQLESPRFAVEGDQVTLSTIVRNDLGSKKDVTAELVVPAELFESASTTRPANAADKEGNLHLSAQVAIEAHAQHRIDWPLTARTDGVAAISVQAVCDEAGDAMRVKLPIRARGSFRTKSRAGIAAIADNDPQAFSFDLPSTIDRRKTQIDVSLAATPWGSLFDAIPFLAGYPYGCVEQTMSRFYPTVVAVDALRKLKVDLRALADHAGRTGPQRTHGRHGSSPLLDPAELDRMTQAGLERLSRFQHRDGGWGWWEHDASTPFMTAYVLIGLDAARAAGVTIRTEDYDRGVAALYETLGKPAETPQTSRTRETQVLVCYALSLGSSEQTPRNKRIEFNAEKSRRLAETLDTLVGDRQRLTPAGRALLALALEHLRDRTRANEVLGELLKSVRVDQTRALAWIPASHVEWWHWYNSDIETNAWTLRALVAIDPRNPLCAQIASWLASSRRHGNFWSGTRDTALAVHALAEYMRVANEDAADFTIDVLLDGRPVAQAKVRWNRSSPLRAADNWALGRSHVALDAHDLQPGRHVVTLAKSRPGPLYYAITASYLDHVQQSTADGHEIRIERHYYRVAAPSATRGERAPHSGRPALVDRTPLRDGDAVHVGDVVETELTITNGENYDFVAFEDPKPAGFEPVELRSGDTWGEAGGQVLCANLELRDEQVVFFSRELDAGRHVLRYQLRAETPGSFQARPTHAFDMYNPEIEAHSDSMRLQVRD